MTELLLRLRVDPTLLGGAAPLVAKLAPLLGLALASLLLLTLVHLATLRFSDDRDGRFGRAVMHAFLQGPLWVVALVSRWGANWWAVVVGVGVGLAISLTVFQLGRNLGNLWRARRLTVPLLAGLVWGGGFLATLTEGVWLEGVFWVTDHASVARCIRRRLDTYEDQNGNKTTTLVYLDHVDVISQSGAAPQHDPSCQLLDGADEVELQRLELVGGRFYSEKRDAWSPFRWLLPERREPDKPLRFARGAQLVRSNFHGRPVRDGVPVPPPIPPPAEGAPLSVESELPDPSRSPLGDAGAFFARLLNEDEFRPFGLFLLSFHLALFGALFHTSTRGPTIAFLLGATLSFLSALLLLMQGLRNVALAGALSVPDAAGATFVATGAIGALEGAPPTPRSRLRSAPLALGLAALTLAASLGVQQLGTSGPARGSLLAGLVVHLGAATLLVNVAFLIAAGLALEWRVRRTLFIGAFLTAGLATLWLERRIGAPTASGLAGAVGALLGLAIALPDPDPRAHLPLSVSPPALAMWFVLATAVLTLVDARGVQALGPLLGLSLGLVGGGLVRRHGWEGWRRAVAPARAP